jgi:hypothetical protein
MIERKNRGMGKLTPLIFKPFSAPTVNFHCPLPNFKNSGRDLCNLFLLYLKLLSRWSNFSDNLESEPRYAQSQLRQDDSLLRSITRPPLHPAFRPKSPAPPTPLPRPAHGDLAVPPPLRRLTQKRLTITHSSDEDASGL